MADTPLSSLTSSLTTVFNSANSSTDPNATPLVGTIADPANLSNVANANTAMSVGSIAAIGTTMARANLSLNLDPAKKLADCFMSLEDRIMDKATEKAMELLMNNQTASTVVSAINKAQSYAATVQELVNVAKSIKPKDLLTQLAIAKGLQGLERVVKIQEVLATFGGVVNNITDMINNLDVLDICKSPNYAADGTSVPSGLSSPASAPVASAPVYPGATVNATQINTKNEYDALMFEIKNYTGKDPTKTDSASYVSMITSVNTIALAYHDKLMKSTTNADDARFASEFKNSVRIELNVHVADWDEELKNDYNYRCENIGLTLGNSGDVVRAYAMRNQTGPISGSLMSKGVTWYSGPYGDYTTFLDLKESERTPDLIAHWQSKGKAVSGIRSGPLKLSDTTLGPTGIKLVSDFSCASTRVPIGSVLALKNPDGTPYNPSGKNPSGVYTVHDTGSLPNTYNKPDIFTNTPGAYDKSNMEAVQVFLVSKGTVTSAPQYKLAQQRYGGKSIPV